MRIILYYHYYFQVRPYLLLEHFNFETIKGKNSAAAGLCNWVVNIVIYRDIVVTVEPKRIALAKATDELNAGACVFLFYIREGGKRERKERDSFVYI